MSKKNRIKRESMKNTFLPYEDHKNDDDTLLYDDADFYDEDDYEEEEEDYEEDYEDDELYFEDDCYDDDEAEFIDRTRTAQGNRKSLLDEIWDD